MAFDLFIEITFPMTPGKEPAVNSNMKSERIPDIIGEFLRSQQGKGADHRKAAERDEYKIRLELDLSFDTFRASDDCGNLGLRDGILMEVRSILEKRNAKAT